MIVDRSRRVSIVRLVLRTMEILRRFSRLSEELAANSLLQRIEPIYRHALLKQYQRSGVAIRRFDCPGVGTGGLCRTRPGSSTARAGHYRMRTGMYRPGVETTRRIS